LWRRIIQYIFISSHNARRQCIHQWLSSYFPIFHALILLSFCYLWLSLFAKSPYRTRKRMGSKK
jgi:hypothetical protein